MQAKLDDTEFLAEQMRLLHGQLQMLWQNFEKLIAGEKDSRRGFERTEKAFSRAVRTGTSPAGVKRRNLAYATPCQMCELRQESGHQGLLRIKERIALTRLPMKRSRLTAFPA